MGAAARGRGDGGGPRGRGAAGGRVGRAPVAETAGGGLAREVGGALVADPEATVPTAATSHPRFGTVATFNIAYISNARLFPTLFGATSMGICNMTARVATIGAPLVAEVRGVFPLWVVFVLCSAAAASTLFLRKPDYL